MTDKEHKLAQQVYQTVCAALDERRWKYKKEEEKLLVHFGVNGEALPIQMIIVVDAQRQLIRVMSPLQYKFEEEKRVEGALAVSAASYGMADGGFDYDISDGQVVFRATASFRESVIGVGLMQYLISLTCAMVDKYSADFLALGKGYLSIEDFIKKATQ